ncbi:hypothetical protein U9M48_013888 [Paspalum notatum var. saurae]|uniref:Uncharacterized protein n=1 Tax=Paspalum notatum var. saurae TaxID=547442 RepID=A0AAQ3T1D7_PASNO
MCGRPRGSEGAALQARTRSAWGPVAGVRRGRAGPCRRHGPCRSSTWCRGDRALAAEPLATRFPVVDTAPSSSPPCGDSAPPSSGTLFATGCENTGVSKICGYQWMGVLQGPEFSPQLATSKFLTIVAHLTDLHWL